MLSCIAIFLMESVYYIIPFCSSFGLLMTVLTTLPYQMISEYHQDENYVNNCVTSNKRGNFLLCFLQYILLKIIIFWYCIIGMGIDCSLLSSSFFLAQFVVSVIMSPFISIFGTRVIMLVGCFFAFVGLLIIKFYVIFPKNNASTKYKENLN